MSSTKFELTAKIRTVTGKLACKRLRLKEQSIPAVIYGGKQPNSLIYLDHNQVLKGSDQEQFYSQILTLIVDGVPQKVLLKDLQRHPFKPKILHLDFQRVTETDLVTLRVPLHFTGADRCPGVKAGGIINHHCNTVEIRCQAQFLPEFIEVDLTNIELGQIVHLSNLKLAEHVEIPGLIPGSRSDIPVVSVQLIKATAEPQVSAEAAATSDKESGAKEPAKDSGKTAGASPKAAGSSKTTK